MRTAVILAALAFVSCSVGKGTGHFEGCLHYPACDEDYDETVEACTAENPNYSLSPEFFSAQVLQSGALLITIQKDGYWMGESDGISLLIPDFRNVSRELDEDGVDVVEKTIPPREELESLPESERYEASYYLNESCSGHYASFSGGTGTLRLTSLYRPESENEKIKGDFSLYFEDPRPVEEGETKPHLDLEGDFSFTYEKGVPAQHFP
jgi:hypothetical protein